MDALFDDEQMVDRCFAKLAKGKGSKAELSPIKTKIIKGITNIILFLAMFMFTQNA
jgi:hypothetical protein